METTTNPFAEKLEQEKVAHGTTGMLLYAAGTYLKHSATLGVIKVAKNLAPVQIASGIYRVSRAAKS